MNAYSTILHFVAIVAAVTATDYCPLHCGFNTKNIACGNSGKFADSCPFDAKLVPIDTVLKQFIVDGHNAKRNFIAGGGEAKLSPACSMATMEWNEELAYLASLNVKKCALTHDCISTPVFIVPGQNLGRMSYEKVYNTTENMDKAMEMWYKEVKNTNQFQIDSHPEIDPKEVIGHFTVMMGDRNVRVGCAAATYASKNDENPIFMATCNYAFDNIAGSPSYKTCKKAASACTTGKNPQYPNLCSASEDYGYGFIPK